MRKGISSAFEVFGSVIASGLALSSFLFLGAIGGGLRSHGIGDLILEIEVSREMEILVGRCTNGQLAQSGGKEGNRGRSHD